MWEKFLCSLLSALRVFPVVYGIVTPVFFKIDRSKPMVDLIWYTNIKYD